MTIELELQIASNAKTLPHPAQFREWIGNTLNSNYDNLEITIRIVDIEEMTELNETYRKKTGPTNVLSFPADLNESFGVNSLGDIIICAPIVETEASEGNIDLIAHWAHMVVHGTLHLLGYDHIIPQEADEMEAIETKILTKLGYHAPYGDKLPHS